MRILESNRISKNRYTIVINISDEDIEMFEDLAYVYVTKGRLVNNKKIYDIEHELLPEYMKWCEKWYHELWKHTWRKYD